MKRYDFDHLRKEEIRSKDVFFHLVFDRPSECEKVAYAANLNLSRNCRHCGLEVSSREDAGTIVGYWVSTWFLAHKDCVKPGKSSEAFHCQTIDADCNDCKHFERGRFNKRFSNEAYVDPKLYQIFTGDQEADAKDQERYILDMLYVGSFEGVCQKFQRPTLAWPGTCTLHTCFEHRKGTIQ